MPHRPGTAGAPIFRSQGWDRGLWGWGAVARSKGMLRRPRWVAGGAVVLVLAGGAGAWAVTRSEPAATARTVTSTVSAGTVEQTVSATGTIDAARRADLSFPVAGEVTAVKALVGSKVTKNQVLARIGSAELARAVDVATANRDAAAAQLDAAEDAGASDTQVASAAAQLASAKDRLAAAKDDLAAATLRSPFDGIVASVDLAVGDRVSGSGVSGSGGSGSGGSGAGGGTSSAQVVVVSTGSYVVDAAVSGADLASLKKGQQARITPTGASDAVFGTVSSVGVVASSSSGGAATFPVQIKVTGSPAGLHPGGSAAVVIVVKKLDAVLTVPTAALRQEGGKTVVTKLVDGAKVTTPVELGTSYGPSTQVTSGLADGDQVEVTVGAAGAGRTGGTGTRQNGTGGFGGDVPFPGGGFPGGGTFTGGTFTGGTVTGGTFTGGAR